MNDIKQIKEIARTIFESHVAIDGIDLAFAAIHGADMEDSHFMRIAGHLYRNGYRKTFTGDFASDTQKASKEGLEKACSAIKEMASATWISVAERLPDPSEHDWVLVAITFDEDGSYDVPKVAEYRDGEWYEDDPWGDGRISALHCTVTHWRPLPGLPKESEDTE